VEHRQRHTSCQTQRTILAEYLVLLGGVLLICGAHRGIYDELGFAVGDALGLTGLVGPPKHEDLGNYGDDDGAVDAKDRPDPRR
jgi:hypothetical protein